MAVTLKELLDENPDWADLPIGVLNSVGDIDYVGDSGMVYADSDIEEGETILIFTGN